MANKDFAKFFTADALTDLSSFGLASGSGFQILIDIHRKNLEAFGEAHHITVETFQACMRRHAEMVSEILHEGAAMISDVMGQGPTEQKVVRQADMMKKSYEYSVAGLRELAEILNKSGLEASNLLNKRVSASFTEVKSAMEKSARIRTAANQKAAA